MADAWKAFAEFKKTQLDTGKRSSADGFGTRAFLKDHYIDRMAAAVLGIYGNSKDEAIYPVYFVDSDKQKLDGTNRYALRFAPGQLPPVNAFWSLTMYRAAVEPALCQPAQPLPDQFADAAESEARRRRRLDALCPARLAGRRKESNWLPAPSGPFFAVLRLYWPKAEALNGKWKAPPLQTRTDVAEIANENEAHLCALVVALAGTGRPRAARSARGQYRTGHRRQLHPRRVRSLLSATSRQGWRLRQILPQPRAGADRPSDGHPDEPRHAVFRRRCSTSMPDR